MTDDLLKLVALFLFITLPAQALEVVPKYGFEKNALQSTIGSSDRLLGLELIQPLASAHKLKVEGGKWFVKDPTHASSFYATAQWGYRVQLDFGLMLEAYLGPGWVEKLDDHTSSHLEIFHDLSLGWMAEGFGMALSYRHISNAGLWPPNLGRDFGMMRFIVPVK